MNNYIDDLEEILKMPLLGCDIQEWADAIKDLISQAQTEARIDENQTWLNIAGSPGYVRYWAIQDRLDILNNKEKV